MAVAKLLQYLYGGASGQLECLLCDFLSRPLSGCNGLYFQAASTRVTMPGSACNFAKQPIVSRTLGSRWKNDAHVHKLLLQYAWRTARLTHHKQLMLFATFRCSPVPTARRGCANARPAALLALDPHADNLQSIGIITGQSQDRPDGAVTERNGSTICTCACVLRL